MHMGMWGRNHTTPQGRRDIAAGAGHLGKGPGGLGGRHVLLLVLGCGHLHSAPVKPTFVSHALACLFYVVLWV